MCKISEQQVNPKVLLVSKYCHNNENFLKMADIVYRQMPAPRELPNKSPPHGQQFGYKSPRVGTSFWCKSPGCTGDGYG